MKARWLMSGAVLAGLFFPCGQRAAAEEPEGGRLPHCGPPPEAIRACSAQQEGAACAFAIDGNQATGTCRAGPRGLPAACFPAGGPHHAPRCGPPPEAIHACAGMDPGATCAFTLDGNTLDGVCRPGPGGEPAACLPSRPPPRR